MAAWQLVSCRRSDAVVVGSLMLGLSVSVYCTAAILSLESSHAQVTITIPERFIFSRASLNTVKGQVIRPTFDGSYVTCSAGNNTECTGCCYGHGVCSSGQSGCQCHGNYDSLYSCKLKTEFRVQNIGNGSKFVYNTTHELYRKLSARGDSTDDLVHDMLEFKFNDSTKEIQSINSVGDGDGAWRLAKDVDGSLCLLDDYFYSPAVSDALVLMYWSRDRVQHDFPSCLDEALVIPSHQFTPSSDILQSVRFDVIDSDVRGGGVYSANIPYQQPRMCIKYNTLFNNNNPM